MRVTVATLVAVWLTLLLITPVLAQSSGQFVFVDELGELDQAAIEAAAQPLLERGAHVAVMLVEDGSDPNDVEQILAAEDLAADGIFNPNLISIYVAIEPPTSDLFVGERWNDTVGAQLEDIRQNELNPLLQAGDFTGGYVATLNVIDGATAEFNPLPFVLGGLGLAGAGAGTFAFMRRQAAEKRTNAAREEKDQAKQAAGALIVDSGRLLRDARDKALYDKVSYDAADVVELQVLQQDLDARFVAMQQQFDQTENDLLQQSKPDITDLQAAEQRYREIEQAATQLRTELQGLADKRAELDQYSHQSRDKLEQARQAPERVAAQAAELGSDYPDQQAIVALLQPGIRAAEQADAENEIRQIDEKSSDVLDLVQRMIALFDQGAALQERIVEGQNDAERLAAEGYRMESSRNHLRRAIETRNTALQQLQRGGNNPEQVVATAEESMELAQAALAEAVANGAALVGLRQENAQRQSELEQRFAAVEQLIEQGYQTFDKVDDFAEETWSDIRGNGSTADAAADQAQQLLVAAREANTMEAQQFRAAKQNLDTAKQELTKAQQLIAAIDQRLQELEQARDSARAEIAAATDDLNRGQQFLQQHDQDISETPEQQLREAAELLATVRAEMEKPHPNWISIVRQARQVNQMADAALAASQSEVERLKKLRAQAERARQTAANELQRTERYLDSHSHDITTDNVQAVQALNQTAHGQQNLLAQRSLDGLSTTELESLLNEYSRLEDQAESLYTRLQSDVNRREEQRREQRREQERRERARRERERHDRMSRQATMVVLGSTMSSNRSSSRRSSSSKSRSSSRRSSSSSNRSRGSFSSSGSKSRGSRSRGGW